MADTKSMTREERKAAKRTARKGLKKDYRALTTAEQKEFRTKSKGGVKGFRLGTNEEDE